MTRSARPTWIWTNVLLAWATCVAGAQPAESTSSAPATQTATTASQPATAESELKPRLQLHIPSLMQLIVAGRASHSGVWFDQIGRMMEEISSESTDGIELTEVSALLNRVKSWPDTAVHASVYAADTQGRTRWALQLDWPLEDLHARLAPLVSSEAAANLLAGVTLRPRGESGYAVELPESKLAYVTSCGPGRSQVASHPEMECGPTDSRLAAGSDGDAPALISCRLNMAATEKDSGATFFSSFRAVTDIVYSARVAEGGDWAETVDVRWPPISGMGAKVVLDKVKQPFFVPEEAFGALVLNSMSAPGLLVNAMGLGPQFVMDASGEMSVMGDADHVGPIGSALGSEICVTVLPGTGVLPAPDIIVQVRAKRDEKLIEEVRSAAREINAAYREREQQPPWHEEQVRDRAVFWSDSGGQAGMVMLPLVMRPVLFVTRETTGEDKRRDFLVVAWTSTSPQALVRRWLDLPRRDKRRELPCEKKTDGQLWIHWRQLYTWISPYVNMTLSVVLRDALLPRTPDIAEHLTDAWVTMKLGYAGVTLSHRGPIPAGALLAPALLGGALSMDSDGSDLARERLACDRLKVLYHHSKLFKHDLGRWPAEVAELDGYVDFAGHPELLRLNVSARKQWSEWLKDRIESAEKSDEETEEDTPDNDAKRFVIEWSRESWSLGYVPGTFEHLEKLYIDQAGEIHRLERK